MTKHVSSGGEATSSPRDAATESLPIRESADAADHGRCHGGGDGGLHELDGAITGGGVDPRGGVGDPGAGGDVHGGEHRGEVVHPLGAQGLDGLLLRDARGHVLADDAGQQQVNGRGTVGAAQLDRLRVVRQLVNGRLGGVRITEHRVVDVLPSQGHAHEDGAITVAPANRRGRLLMRHEAQEGGGDRVAEGGEGSCMRQVTADDLQGRLRQARPGRELVDTVLDEAGVEVHARPGLTDRDLR